MNKVNHAILSMTAVCLLLGVIIGVQFKTVKKQSSALDIQRVSEISTELKKATEEKENLLNKLQESEKKVSEYEKASDDELQFLALIKDELEITKMAAGMTEVSGRGITVTLNDSNKGKEGFNEIDPNAFLVHDEDILSVINELNVAGAEAISINGQRIIGTSSVRCVGSVVNINNVKIAAPFVISAIGDPDVLESALKFPGGVVDSLSPWGIEVIIKKSQTVAVPKYDKTINYKEAKIVKEGVLE